MKLYRPAVTTIDFPNELAIVVFTRGCNLRCPVCHNPPLVLVDEYEEPQVWAIDEVIDFARDKWADGICVTGGEPTIHADLVDALSAFKVAGFKTKLDTNGVDPMMRLNAAISLGVLDFVALDVKAPLDDRLHRVAGKVGCDKYVELSISILSESSVAHHFRTVCFEKFLSPQDIGDIANSLPSSGEYLLLPFDPHDTLDKDLRNEKPAEYPYLRACLAEARKHVQNTRISGMDEL